MTSRRGFLGLCAAALTGLAASVGLKPKEEFVFLDEYSGWPGISGDDPVEMTTMHTWEYEPCVEVEYGVCHYQITDSAGNVIEEGEISAEKATPRHVVNMLVEYEKSGTHNICWSAKRRTTRIATRIV
jgi:hypothetical protein